MKSCLSTLLVVVTLAALIGCGALIWYLSSTAEISRKPAPPAARAVPVAPTAVAPPVVIPRAQPVR
jgi:hypothetical protein